MLEVKRVFSGETASAKKLSPVRSFAEPCSRAEREVLGHVRRPAVVEARRQGPTKRLPSLAL
jgi:hypothetical protein